MPVNKVAETHTVHTDALGTIGMLLSDTAGRDAIHLAVEPVICGEGRLYPGQHVSLHDGKAFADPVGLVGIVDPFLTGPVNEGQRFWLVVYPRTITSLRHVWEHPAFPPVGTENIVEKEVVKEVVVDKVSLSKQWIEDNRDYHFDGLSYEDIMEAADEYQHGEYLVQGGRFEGMGVPDTFWDHYCVIRGKDRSEIETGSFFSCSC